MIEVLIDCVWGFSVLTIVFVLAFSVYTCIETISDKTKLECFTLTELLAHANETFRLYSVVSEYCYLISAHTVADPDNIVTVGGRGGVKVLEISKKKFQDKREILDSSPRFTIDRLGTSTLLKKICITEFNYPRRPVCR